MAAAYISKDKFRDTISDLFLIECVLCENEDELEAKTEEFLDLHILTESQRRFYTTNVQRSHSLIGDLLPNYDDKRFRSVVRMSRGNFWNLHEMIRDHLVFRTPNQHPTCVQLLLTLFRFGMYGNSASYFQLAKDFGVSDGGTINQSTYRVIQALLTMESPWIKWPNAAQRQAIGLEMEAEKLPYCVGFVDGVHVILEHAPSDDPISYYNRKGTYSLNVMLVCDLDKNIIAYHVGQPGKVHDSKVFSLSKISRHPSQHFSEHEYLIGDSAYGLTMNMITPFRRTRISKDQEQFNYHISNRRVKIEHVNGLLKGRFASLKGLRMKINRTKGHRFACEWTVACLILHNMLQGSDPWDPDPREEDDDDEYEGCSQVQDDAAKRKRIALMEHVLFT